MTELDAGRRPDGPPPGALATIALALSAAAVVVPLLLARTAFPGPASSPDEVVAYLSGHRLAALWTGVLTAAASVPVGLYAAAAYARLRRLGIRVAGPAIALVGGVCASVLLAVAGLLGWALAQDAAGVPGPVLRLLTDVVAALGGVGFVGGLGLLVAGLAVPGVILGLVPRRLAWVGLVLAAVCEVSFVALLWPGLDVLVPVGRFAGLVWLAAAGFLLPRSRHDVPAPATRRRR